MVVPLPCCVHVTPFGERYPVKVFPLRMSLTQYGAAKPVVLLLALLPPVLERYWKVTPLLGVTAMNALAESAFKLSRIITPAFDHGSVLWSETTRATIVQFPVTGT
jgi:hypothetical protein